MQPTAIMNFCPDCGTDLHAQEGRWPKRCPNPDCKKPEHWHPVLTVVVCIIQIDDQLLIIQRKIEPEQGGWAFPGGYQNFGETAQEAAARELFEETGLRIPVDQFHATRYALSTSGMSLIFFSAEYPKDGLRSAIKLCETEVLDYKLVNEPTKLCFPSHQAVINELLGPHVPESTSQA